MQLAVAYRGRSNVQQTPAGVAVSLAPNLRRDRVSFVGTLRQPCAQLLERIAHVPDPSDPTAAGE